MIALYVRVVVLSALITGCATSSNPQANVEQLPIQAPCQMPPLYGQDMADQGAEGSGSLDLLAMDEREAARRLGLLNKIGAFLDVRTLVAAADRGTGEDEVILLRIRQQLSDQLLIASVDIAAFTGFIDCEAVRASHLAAILESSGAERQRTRTIFGILGDALIGITAGIFSLGDLSTAAAVASILGGVSSTGAGASALLGGRKTMPLRHPDDVLAEVWSTPADPQLLPTTVSRFLNSSYDGQEHRSYREVLIAYWREQGWLGETDSEVEQRRLKLFFRGGGDYQLEDLRTRAQMLQLVKSFAYRESRDSNSLAGTSTMGRFTAVRVGQREAIISRPFHISSALTGLPIQTTMRISRTLIIGMFLSTIIGCQSVSQRESRPSQELPCLPSPLQQGHDPAERAATSGDLSSAAIDLSSFEVLGFSRDTDRTARIVGVEDLLARLVRVEGLRDVEVNALCLHLSLLRVHQQLSDRLLLVSTEIGRLVGHLDCEMTRTRRKATELQSRIATHQRLWTLYGALLGDALIGLTGGTFALADAAVAVAAAKIAGGSVAATLGGNAVLMSRQKIALEHPGDIIGELWEAPVHPRWYPAPVWRYLLSIDADDPSATKRERVIAYWYEQGWLSRTDMEQEQQRVALFFNGGGDYALDELHARERMLAALKATIILLNRDIRLIHNMVRRVTDVSLQRSLLELHQRVRE